MENSNGVPDLPMLPLQDDKQRVLRRQVNGQFYYSSIMRGDEVPRVLNSSFITMQELAPVSLP